MTANHTMQTLISYGSKYGSAEHYAKNFAEYTGLPVLPYSEVKEAEEYGHIIHFGALYAGGVLGLKHIMHLLSQKTKLTIVTVGIADVNDAENIRNIRRSIQLQMPDDVFKRVNVFHLRGAIDYSRLSFKHRAMMALLYAKARKLPEEKKTADVQSLIETYGKYVSFVDDTRLYALADSICAQA